MNIETVKRVREAAETRASNIAATLPDGDYYASSEFAVNRDTKVYTDCGTHWDACLVMMAVSRRMAA